MNILHTLKELAGANIKIDMIHSSSFVISKFDVDLVKKLLNENRNYIINDDIAKISTIGVGVTSNTEVMCHTFKILEKNKIEMLAISTSEIKISVIVKKEYAEALVRNLHTEYGLDLV